MNDQWIVLGSVLGLKDTASSDRVEGVRSQSIDSLGRHAHDLTRSQKSGSVLKNLASVLIRDDRDRVFEVRTGGICD
jgi:hypothetical protein